MWVKSTYIYYILYIYIYTYTLVIDDEIYKTDMYSGCTVY